MNKIKYLLLVITGFILTPVLRGQPMGIKAKTFYIVRHAEKDTGNNPAISAAGKNRAGDLYRVLKNKKIDLILVSQFRRSGMTADSLRIYKNIDTLHYTADATSDLILKKIISSAGNAKSILIIGHSNTLPSIIKKLGVENYLQKDIPDTEYDHLFIVKYKSGKAILQSKKYGSHSVLPAKAAQMNLLQ